MLVASDSANLRSPCTLAVSVTSVKVTLMTDEYICRMLRTAVCCVAVNASKLLVGFAVTVARAVKRAIGRKTEGQRRHRPLDATEHPIDVGIAGGAYNSKLQAKPPPSRSKFRVLREEAVTSEKTRGA